MIATINKAQTYVAIVYKKHKTNNTNEITGRILMNNKYKKALEPMKFFITTILFYCLCIPVYIHATETKNLNFVTLSMLMNLHTMFGVILYDNYYHSKVNKHSFRRTIGYLTIYPTFFVLYHTTAFLMRIK